MDDAREIDPTMRWVFEVQRETKALLKEWEAERLEHESRVVEDSKKALGSDLVERGSTHPDLFLDLTTSENPEVRASALRLLNVFKNRVSDLNECARSAMKLATLDENFAVRLAGTHLLDQLSGIARRNRLDPAVAQAVLRTLFRIVMEPAERWAARKSAYATLLIVLSGSASRLPRPFRFKGPESIDWQLLTALADETGGLSDIVDQLERRAGPGGKNDPLI